MASRKIVEVSSFDWAGGIPIPTIVDDTALLRKIASSPIAEKWRGMKPDKDCSLVHLAAMGTFESVGSNQNGDAFEYKFLKVAHPTFVSDAYLFRNHMAFYKTASGGIIEDPALREGSVKDSALWDAMQRVELLVSARHDKCADWLGEIERGDMVCFSMGFDCEYDECSKCGQKTYSPPEGYCEHVRKKASYPFGMNAILPDGSKCFVFNRKGKFKDISKVGVGADMTAFHLRKVAHAADSGVIGGAELASLYEDMNGTKNDPFRISAFAKLAAAEKRIAAMGMVLSSGDEEDEPVISDEVATALSRAGSPKEAMSWLADRNVVLPPRSFFKVAMALTADPSDVDAVARKMASGGFSWADSQGLRGAVVSNSRWEPGRHGSGRDLPIRHRDELDIAQSMSASENPIERSVKVASRKIAGISAIQDLTPGQSSLAVEYLSYRLSAACRLAEKNGPESLFSVL